MKPPEKAAAKTNNGPHPEKTERNQEIRELRRAGQTRTAIAGKFGISIERVRQICFKDRTLT